MSEVRNIPDERPAWSVIGGAFDPETTIINSASLSLMVKPFWDLNPESQGRRNVQSIELVLKAYELCGIETEGITEKILERAIAVKDFPRQVLLIEITPILGEFRPVDDTNIEDTQSSPSPVMNAVRALIDFSNSLESMVFEDEISEQNERWQVDARTKRQAEAIVRSLYLEEFTKGSSVPDPLE